MEPKIGGLGGGACNVCKKCSEIALWIPLRWVKQGKAPSLHYKAGALFVFFAPASQTSRARP